SRPTARANAIWVDATVRFRAVCSRSTTTKSTPAYARISTLSGVGSFTHVPMVARSSPSRSPSTSGLHPRRRRVLGPEHQPLADLHDQGVQQDADRRQHHDDGEG